MPEDERSEIEGQHGTAGASGPLETPVDDGDEFFDDEDYPDEEPEEEPQDREGPDGDFDDDGEDELADDEEWVYVDENGDEWVYVDDDEELGPDEEWVYVDDDESEDDDEWEYVEVDEDYELGPDEEWADEDDEGPKKKKKADKNPLAYDKVQSTTDDLNHIYREGAATARDLKEAYDDIKSLMDFKNMFKL